MAYAGGLGGVSEDFAEALKWYRMAAHQGDMNAMHNLGVMYDWGQGVQQDWVEAEKWYRKAAELGHLEAQSQLRGRPNAVRKIAILIKSLRPKDRE